jgi:hypothetical protein
MVGLGLGLVSAVAFAQQRLPTSAKFNVPPGSPTKIQVQTIPFGSCVLHSNDRTDESTDLDIIADDLGTANFYAHLAISAPPQQLTLNCRDTDTGAEITHAVEVTADSSMPNVTSNVNYYSVDYSHRRQCPGLSGAPLTEAESKLVGVCFPDRPDPAQFPDAHQKWLRLVSQPRTRIMAKTVPRRHPLHAGTPSYFKKTSSNWSGFWIGHTTYNPATNSKPFPTYYWNVDAIWYLPNIWADPTQVFSGFNSDVAVWVGMNGTDGNGCNAMPQAGTNSQLVTPNSSSFFVSYSIWYELWYNCVYNGVRHSDPGMSTFGVDVGPEDVIETNVYMANYDGSSNPRGDTAWSYIVDYTHNFYAMSRAPIPTQYGVGYRGNSAEWIVERPSLGGVVLKQIGHFNYDMTSKTYSPITLYGTWAQDLNVTNPAYIIYKYGDAAQQVDMVSDPVNSCPSKTLTTATVGPLDGEGQDMTVTWQRYDPGMCYPCTSQKCPAQ